MGIGNGFVREVPRGVRAGLLAVMLEVESPVGPVRERKE